MSAPHRLVHEDSPVGPLTLEATETGLTRVSFGASTAAAKGVHFLASPIGHPVLESAGRALAAYFGGDSDALARLPVDLAGGTDFQQAVWGALRAIPAGDVTSYGELVRVIGRGSPRAVGQAVGANPVPVVVPCHRVVAGDGRLGGFSGGLERKVALLELEGIASQGARFDARIRLDSDAPLQPVR
ncbi:MAG: methylated-DNA--[protein]-cysteine S-methyltransferase [Gemmatimonadales bacterium]|nr:MAG: methylated-DNA--[protein]-cysteine S-methyltransferase [Gemmatimonadales bacterium]